MIYRATVYDDEYLGAVCDVLYDDNQNDLISRCQQLWPDHVVSFDAVIQDSCNTYIRTDHLGVFTLDNDLTIGV